MKTINEEIAELRKRLDELKKQQSKGWVFVPDAEQEYWYIENGKCIGRFEWGDDSMDNELLSTGNCYPTKEAAKQVVLNRKIHRFLQEQTDFVADWEDAKQQKWCLVFSYYINDWDWYEVEGQTRHPNTVYFASGHDGAQDAGEAAIDKFGLEAFEGYLKGSIV